tara:strand:+ start:117 stop:935 length:819 start_codon:yes stop_codon:yes gene_type:complete
MGIFDFTKKNITNGDVINYHKNGEIKEKYFLAGGNKFGNYESYYENGKIKYKGRYHSNKPEGVHQSYDKSGSLELEKNYGEIVKIELKNNKKEKTQNTFKKIDKSELMKNKIIDYENNIKNFLSINHDAGGFGDKFNLFEEEFIDSKITLIKDSIIKVNYAYTDDDYETIDNIIKSTNILIDKIKAKIVYQNIYSSPKNILQINAPLLIIIIIINFAMFYFNGPSTGSTIEGILINSYAVSNIVIIIALFRSFKNYLNSKNLINDLGEDDDE